MTDDLHHLAAPYALDALEPDERRRFEHHLAECPECLSDVDEFRETTGDLAIGVSTRPPAHVRSAVLAAVAGAPGESTHETRATRRWSRWVLTAAAAVLVLLTASVGVVARSAIVERDRAAELLAVFVAPDARESSLEATGAPAGSVRVVWSEGLAAAVVLASDLGVPGDDQTYELWSLAADGPRSAGTFDPAPDGSVERRLDLPAAPATGWGVTLEPRGGSPRPTGDILFLGS